MAWLPTVVALGRAIGSSSSTSTAAPTAAATSTTPATGVSIYVAEVGVGRRCSSRAPAIDRAVHPLEADGTVYDIVERSRLSLTF